MTCFKELDLIQGTPEWLAWRLEHITATDSAKIMGLNPWSSPLDCYNEKKEGKTTFVTPAMQRGMDLEPVARNLLIDKYGLHLSPAVFESVEYPFMGASLDAISEDNKTLYEIKCVGEKTFSKALDNVIDPMYLVQCQKQMLVMGLESMQLFYYFNDFLHCIKKIMRDEDLIKKIIEADTNFWNENMLLSVSPQKYGDEYERIIDDEANELALKWVEYSSKEKEAKQAKDIVAKQLEVLADKRKCIFPEARLKHQVVDRKGLVDWKKVCVAWTISDKEVEKYRKENTSYSSFKLM